MPFAAPPARLPLTRAVRAIRAVFLVSGWLGAVSSLSSCLVVGEPPTLPPQIVAPEAPSEVVALAGADLVVVEGARVVLSAVGSRALEGVPGVSWSQREGPAVVLSNPSSPSPSFRAPLAAIGDEAPVRLVFQLQARVDDKADVDLVVVDVVDRVPRFRPRLGEAPADVVTAAGAPVTVTFRWPDPAAPAVTARCPIRGALDVVHSGNTLTVTLSPAVLPCAVVVDDGDATDDIGVGRAVVTLQPPGTVIPGTTSVADRVVAPGVFVNLEADFNDGVVVGVADGSDVEFDATGFRAPQTLGRLELVAERRENGVSGGVELVAIDVDADGAAPSVEAGADLEVQPGARFRIAATGRDVDGDDVTLAVEQVIGPPAARVSGFLDVLTAPDLPTTLLFHVTAFDGVVRSEPDPVRVVVNPTVQNLPPELSLPSTIYATPGAPFTIDAEDGARDDAGLITSWEIAQEETDVVVVLPTAVAEPRVTLVAGAAGDHYRFRVSAYDDGGLGVTVEVEVVVEEAGPYVDPARGSDDSGTGDVARPFATIAAALDTAARHRFPQLLLAAADGEQTHTLAGRLPDGLGLQGGQVFNGTAYDGGGAPADVEVVGDAFVVEGDVGAVSFTGAGTLHLEQDVALDDVSVEGALAVDAGARVTASAFVGAVVVSDADFSCDGCTTTTVSATGSSVELRAGSFGAVSVDGGVFIAGNDVGFDAVVVAGGANVALGTVDAVSLSVDDGAVSVDGGRFRAVSVSATSSLRGALFVTDDGITGDGVVDLDDSDVTGGVTGADVGLVRCVVDGTVTAANAVVESSIVIGVAVAVDVEKGALRQSTFISGDVVLVVGADVVVENVVVKGPVAGVVPVLAHHTGFVVDEGFVDCDGCVAGNPDDVDASGHLGAGDNPFVDAGADLGIEFDVDAEAFGAAPDLGADERVEDG